MPKTRDFNMQAYVEQITTGPCFICEMINGNPQHRHYLIYEDDKAIAFLNKYPILYGHVLVSPKEHREQVTGDFTAAEYLELQALIYRVTEAVRQVVQSERVYILSLGSQQGNSHVHWHIAPLPPGMPFMEQQLGALHVKDQILDLSEAEFAQLAENIRQTLG